jgi:hypothetical protein
MKTIDNAAKFLQETGLLAEINRVVLHPRGLALSIIARERPKTVHFDVEGFGPLYEKRDGEGIVFSEKDLAQATAQLRAAEAEGLVNVRPQRRERLGFLIQPAHGVPDPLVELADEMGCDVVTRDGCLTLVPRA